jgi:hypothetical protein
MKKMLVLLAIVFCTAALPAEENATLSGTVTDEAGNPVPEAAIEIRGTDLHTVTDGDGRFSITDIPPGQYDVTCSRPGYTDCIAQDIPFDVDTSVTLNFTLKKPVLEEPLDDIVRKPNIYLYPPETTDITVQLELGEGCKLTRSDPAYGDGWRVTASPDGYLSDSRGYVVGEAGGEEVIFDAPRYGYLFYEAEAPDAWQTERGWLVDVGEDLGDFFAGNLAAYGFNEREIKDFLDYWVPRLTAGYYAVFPQLTADIEPLIGMEVNPEPDSVLRLFYYLVADPLMGGELAPPWIVPFEREGFTVVEWGVILDDAVR